MIVHYNRVFIHWSRLFTLFKYIGKASGLDKILFNFRVSLERDRLFRVSTKAPKHMFYCIFIILG